MNTDFRQGLKLTGYSTLGENGEDGIRYTWKLSDDPQLIESASFNKRTKFEITPEDRFISGYTTSVSSGCILQKMKKECLFCRTGKVLPFKGKLSQWEIAIQNIFMVIADKRCIDHKNINSNKREFAYMGQGEPGFSYSDVRSAIKITDRIMKDLNEKVYRHIIATCGVPELIDSVYKDIADGYFGNTRVTIHFSLHASKNRNLLMPIDNLYPHKEILEKLKDIYNLTGEKPCIGILLFRNFTPKNKNISFTHDKQSLNKLADLLDPEYHRVSLCEYNESKDISSNDNITIEEAHQLIDIFQNKGIETKLFASFGKNENTACGLLGGTLSDSIPGEKMKETINYANELINDCMNCWGKEIC